MHHHLEHHLQRNGRNTKSTLRNRFSYLFSRKIILQSNKTGPRLLKITDNWWSDRFFSTKITSINQCQSKRLYLKYGWYPFLSSWCEEWEYWKPFFFTVKSFLEWASWWSQLPLGPNWHLQLLQLLFRYIEAGGIPSILFHYIALLFSTTICWYPLPFWLPFYFMCARGASSRSG